MKEKLGFRQLANANYPSLDFVVSSVERWEGLREGDQLVSFTPTEPPPSRGRNYLFEIPVP